MQSLENSLHCFLVTFLCITNLPLHILAKDCLLIRHLADKIYSNNKKTAALCWLTILVIFNLFAAGEPSTNTCIAHGTLCHDLRVCPIFCNKPVKQLYWCNRIELWVANFVLGNCSLIWWNPWQPTAEPGGFTEPQVKKY